MKGNTIDIFGKKEDCKGCNGKGDRGREVSSSILE